LNDWIAAPTSGGVGVSAVGDHLHRRGLALRQPALKIRVDLDHHQDLLIVDQPAHVVGVGEVGDPVEHARAIELGQQGG